MSPKHRNSDAGNADKEKKNFFYAEIATIWSKNEPSIWNCEEGKINLC